MKINLIPVLIVVIALVAAYLFRIFDIFSLMHVNAKFKFSFINSAKLFIMLQNYYISHKQFKLWLNHFSNFIIPLLTVIAKNSKDKDEFFIILDFELNDFKDKYDYGNKLIDEVTKRVAKEINNSNNYRNNK